MPTPTPLTSDPARPPDRSGQKALVIGGTGPSGPDVVHGLLNRGFDTTIFHAGTHEVPLPGEVRHIHYRHGPGHRATRGELIRDELGYTDTYGTAAGLAQTADWLTAASPAETAEIESQLGDPFDYDFEDALIAWWQEATASPAEAGDGPYRYSHTYRHPARAGEGWRRA